MEHLKDGKLKRNSEPIPTHFVDRMLKFSIENIDGSIDEDIAIKAVCGKTSPLLWSEDYNDVTCAECNTVILGY